jgi:predicted NUDIX family phosphoesterase
MSKLDELIVVAPRRLVFADEAHTFHGFLPLSDPRAPLILQGMCAAPFTARRGDVEDDPSLLQPIPYVVVARRGAAGRELFAYTRLVGGGEARLHGRVSIGVGGHMNLLFDPTSLRSVVDEEASRELAEELHFHGPDGAAVEPPPARLLGLINDDTGAVQRVHIGLLALVEVPADWQVGVRETERLEGHWMMPTILGASETAARLEEWSLHALDGLPDSDAAA